MSGDVLSLFPPGSSLQEDGMLPGVTADTHASVLTGHAGSKFGLAP